MGLWLLSETLRAWELHGQTHSLTDLVAQAAAIPAGGPTFDPDAPEFLPPGDMPSRIAAACRESGQRPPVTPAEVVRCILDNLATTFAARVVDAQRLSGQRVDMIHIVGGGSQNQLLCQLVADAAGLPVVAGPSRRPPRAICSSRRAPTAHSPATSGRCGRNSAPSPRPDLCRSHLGGPEVTRYCFCLLVSPDRLTEYADRHRRVWPEMQAALRETGWGNYSLFLREDGLLIGYLETDDLDAAQRGMAANRGERTLAG